MMPDQSQNSADPPGDPFDGMPTSEALGLAWQRDGAAGVRTALSAIDQPVPDKPWLLTLEQRVAVITRESLEDAAAVLTRAGLKTAARLVRETAAGRPREIDLPDYEPGTTNHRAWLAAMKRKGKA
jgi:hypothetical protein